MWADGEDCAVPRAFEHMDVVGGEKAGHRLWVAQQNLQYGRGSADRRWGRRSITRSYHGRAFDETKVETDDRPMPHCHVQERLLRVGDIESQSVPEQWHADGRGRRRKLGGSDIVIITMPTVACTSITLASGAREGAKGRPLPGAVFAYRFERRTDHHEIVATTASDEAMTIGRVRFSRRFAGSICVVVVGVAAIESPAPQLRDRLLVSQYPSAWSSWGGREVGPAVPDSRPMQSREPDR